MKRGEYRSANICPSQKHLKYARRAAKNKHGKWVFIANSFKSEEDFEILQVVDFEICQFDEKHECSVDGVSVRHTCKKCLLLSSFIFNFSDCKQNRMEVKLISYHPDTEEVVLDTFLIPSSCACYKKTYY